MINVSDKRCRGTRNKHFMFSKFFFSSENRAVYEIMGKYTVEQGRPQMIIWGMSIACWIPKATNIHRLLYLLLFHCNNGCTNIPPCYVLCTMLKLWSDMSFRQVILHSCKLKLNSLNNICCKSLKHKISMNSIQ